MPAAGAPAHTESIGEREVRYVISTLIVSRERRLGEHIAHASGDTRIFRINHSSLAISLRRAGTDTPGQADAGVGSSRGDDCVTAASD